MKIGFVGGGNMASALIAGLVGKTVAAAEKEHHQIHVIDVNPDALDKLKQQFGVTTALQIDAAIASCDVIVLAVKPQQMQDALALLLPYVSTQLILSIAAGIRSSDLSRWLNGYSAVVRSMPNTPALIGQGITGMFAMAGVSSSQRAMADAIMNAVGSTLWLEEENLIDSVTAVSGSGPAYIFYFMEAMQQAAQEMGLNEEQSRQLTLATFVGGAQLAKQSSEPVSTLRERVTSKGGTTHAALTSMAQSDVKHAIVQAMKAAEGRSRELGEEFGRVS